MYLNSASEGKEYPAEDLAKELFSWYAETLHREKRKPSDDDVLLQIWKCLPLSDEKGVDLRASALQWAIIEYANPRKDLLLRLRGAARSSAESVVTRENVQDSDEKMRNEQQQAAADHLIKIASDYIHQLDCDNAMYRRLKGPVYDNWILGAMRTDPADQLHALRDAGLQRDIPAGGMGSHRFRRLRCAINRCRHEMPDYPYPVEMEQAEALFGLLDVGFPEEAGRLQLHASYLIETTRKANEAIERGERKPTKSEENFFSISLELEELEHYLEVLQEMTEVLKKHHPLQPLLGEQIATLKPVRDALDALRGTPAAMPPAVQKTYRVGWE